jgi:hypothetical protein
MCDLVVRFTTIALEQKEIRRDMHDEKDAEEEPAQAHDNLLADGRTPECNELVHTEVPCGLINLQLNSVPVFTGRLGRILSQTLCAEGLPFSKGLLWSGRWDHRMDATDTDGTAFSAV